jgi:hypothetical protein
MVIAGMVPGSGVWAKALAPHVKMAADKTRNCPPLKQQRKAFINGSLQFKGKSSKMSSVLGNDGMVVRFVTSSNGIWLAFWANVLNRQKQPFELFSRRTKPPFKKCSHSFCRFNFGAW